MTSRFYIDISYSITIDDVALDNLYENSIRVLKDKCPHIMDNELEVHYSQPIPNQDSYLNTQQLFVECPYCDYDIAY